MQNSNRRDSQSTRRGDGSARQKLRRLRAALAASVISIVVNTALLSAADVGGLVTARGGLLALIARYAAAPLSASGLAVAWSGAHLPPTNGYLFKTAFHIVVGLAMGVMYEFTFGHVRWRPITKGLLCALMVWAANAFVVLPLLGEGIAGARTLTAAGILYFAAAHTTFFVLLAKLDAYFLERYFQ